MLDGQVGQAASGIQLERGREGVGGTGVETGGAGPAVFGFGRVGLDLGSGQDDTQEQPVAVVAAEQVCVFALPAEAGALGERLFHQGGGVDEDLDLGRQASGDLAGECLQTALDDFVIVVASGIDGDVAGGAVGHLGQGVSVGAVVHAEHDGGPGVSPHGRGVGTAFEGGLHPAHVAVTSSLDKMSELLSGSPWLGRRGEPAHSEPEFGGLGAEDIAEVCHRALLTSFVIPGDAWRRRGMTGVRNPGPRNGGRGPGPESDRRAAAGSTGGT